MKYAICIALALAGVACSRESSAAPSHENRPAASTAQSDLDLAQKVRDALNADTQLSTTARAVTVVSKDGVITLSGTVPNQADKDHVGMLAGGVNGVKRVENNLAVKG